jgi:hydrogenase nickel incorporation protein HypA/HybF
MHEMAIAQQIIGIAEEILGAHSGKTCKKIYVKIGELTAVIPESLTFAFQALTADTELASASLYIDILPVLGKCRICSKSFNLRDFEWTCPKCQSHEIEIVQGRELHIEKLELDP